MKRQGTFRQKLDALRFTPLMGLLQHAAIGVFSFAAGSWGLSRTTTWSFESVGGALLYLVAAICAYQTIVLTAVIGREAWTASMRRKGRLTPSE